MAGSGKPEITARKFGQEVGRLRDQRGLSQATFATRLTYVLADHDPKYLDRVLGESWVGHLEAGRVVKLPRWLIEAICKALECTPAERRRLLLLADRNVFAADDGTMSRQRERLAQVFARFSDNAEIADLIDLALEHREVDRMTDEEIGLLIADILRVAMPRLRIEYRVGDVSEATAPAHQKDSMP